MPDHSLDTPPAETQLDRIESKLDRVLSVCDQMEELARGFTSGGAGKLMRALMPGMSGGKG